MDCKEQLARTTVRTAILCAVGVTLVLSGGPGLADEGYPTEHKGLHVEQLGVVPAASMAAQVGMGSHIL